MTMKLMSWNVAKKDEKLPQQQLEAIGKAQADILALQEAASSNVEDFKARLGGIGLIHAFTTFDLPDDLGLEIGPSESGLLLASRWPLESMPGFFGKIPWQKSALSVVIKSDYGEIEMHNVHVPNASSSGRWRKEAESGNWTYDKPTPETKKCGRSIKVETFKGVYEALATESQKHLILCGDFNSPKKARWRRD